MEIGTMRLLKAGSNFTLKKGIFCPNTGEGFTRLPFFLALSPRTHPAVSQAHLLNNINFEFEAFIFQ